ncbi:MAG TPA: nickel pincer cofactor biosynthesis protein LarB [Acidimicrobiales bacterium]|nr:nickel pincer cofactor biosynthesis protein LarB [Acidimicrobiales bacterium]
MDPAALHSLLDDVRSGVCSHDDAVQQLRRLPFADLGFAKVDHHRSLRQGFPEAVYGPGKTAAQCSAIVGELLSDGGIQRGPENKTESRTESGAQREAGTGAGASTGADTLRSLAPVSPVLLTRADDEQVAHTMADHAGGSRTITGVATGADRVRGQLSTVVWRPAPKRSARVLVITAGTSDLPVARECEATLVALGFRPDLLPDCGVAGVHRLLASADTLAEADAVVVVAGMEGALASLVGGITPAPVVAVPTSTGYGAALEGVTALLAMHASCAAGVAVVGIDNGYGAACAVARMLP